MNLVAIPAIHYSCAQLASMVGDCFEGYSVPFTLLPAVFAQRFAAEGLSLVDSCIWREGNAIAAVAIIARRGSSARLAAFAVHPHYRGQGVGKLVITELMAALRAKGVRQMWLEVIRDNMPGVALYRSLGFVTSQSLYGYQGKSDVGNDHIVLREVDALEVVRKAAGECNARLPWLADPLSFASLPALAFEYRKHAYAVVATHTETPQLRFIYTEPEYRHHGFAVELLRVLNQHFPGLGTTVAVPESFAPLFTQAEYQLTSISQYEMKADLQNG
ncbi:GNAT family N-acetyltransferase [Salmonella enterica]